VVRHLHDRLRPRGRTARHIFLPYFGVAGQEGAGRAVGEEDRHRVVVSSGSQLGDLLLMFDAVLRRA
jgi:hypothetical protein